MIITITCNPAIDKTVYESKTIFDVGGKGINVSKVLKQLGLQSIATGFVGKENSNIVIDDLNKNEIENHFIEIEGKVRTNTKIITNGKLVEQNEEGPIINKEDIEKIKEYIESFNNDIVIISGSVSNKTDKNIYKDLITILKKQNNFVILDCSGDLLKNGIEAKPNLIKPNKKEICEIFDTNYCEDEIIEKCKCLGIDNICISLGEEGALFIYKDIYKAKALNANVSSTVGAGDAMVAAFAYAKDKNMSIEDSIRFAMATSAAACETEGTKPPTYEDIMDKCGHMEKVVKF